MHHGLPCGTKIHGTKEISDHFLCNKWIISILHYSNRTEFVYFILEVAVIFSNFCEKAICRKKGEI